MTPEPLSPAEVDALLAPDPRTAAADLLVLRDALLALAGAWDDLAIAAARLAKSERTLPRPPFPPRGD